MKYLVFLLLLSSTLQAQNWKYSTSIVPASSGTVVTGPASYTGSALVIVDFNSIGFGVGSSHNITSPDDFAPGPFPTTMMNNLASTFSGATFVKKNFSVNGRTTPQMITDAGQVDAQLNPALYDRQIVVPGEITNDIALLNTSAQQAITNYVTYCQARRAKGFSVVATTILPRTSFLNSGISAAEMENRRQFCNNYLRLHYLEFADVLADIGALPVTLPDGTHPNDAGYVTIGNYIAEKIKPLLVTGFNPQSIPYLLSKATSVAPATPSARFLLLRGQGANNSTSILDSVGHVVTASGSAKISTDQVKFGTSSIRLDGSTDAFLTMPASSDWNLGVADFTMEAWLYRTASGTRFPGLFSRADGVGSQWTLCFPNAGNRLELYVNDGSNYIQQSLNHNTDVPMNQWVHIALVSSGGIRKLYQNGVLVGTASTNSNMELNSANPKRLDIGALSANGGSSGNDVLPCYIYARFTRYALYTAAFTPPASF